MKPHKHAELIKAWADGAEIQWKNKVDGYWEDCLDSPKWSIDYEYRIKENELADEEITEIYNEILIHDKKSSIKFARAVLRKAQEK